MEDENILVKERLRKLQEIEGMGVNAYPVRYSPKDFAETLQKDHSKLKKEEHSKYKAKVAGRIMILRRMGKASFANLRDTTGDIQLYFNQDDLGKPAYKFLKKLDNGDIIGAEGIVFKTKTGEITIYIKKYELLAKSLRPLPDKYHGLKDEDLRYRHRYIDLIANPEVKEVFKKRALINKAFRDYLEKNQFMEVETPVLQPIYGGASAKPFTTVHNALKMNMYLRIANEMYLKRLVVGGFDRVYEFSRDFRNEGIDTSHNPEFTLLETMTAYWNYEDSMKFTEQMLAHVAKEVNGTTEIEYQGKKISLKPPFKRLTMLDAVKKYAGKDFNKIKDDKEAYSVAKGLKLQPPHGLGKWGIMAFIYEELVEDKIIQPTFLMDHPVEVSPLAKKKPENEDFTERFELIIHGREYGNVYSELNEPLTLRKNWEHQRKLKKAGHEETHEMDEDFLRALEIGMPPTSGIGIGIDRFVMLLTNQPSIRDVILFPVLREQKE